MCSLRETTIRQSAGDIRASHGTTASLANTAVAQRKRLHFKSRCEKGWHILDHDLASDVETSERTALDQIAGIVGFSRIDREDVIAPHIHVWAEEV